MTCSLTSAGTWPSGTITQVPTPSPIIRYCSFIIYIFNFFIYLHILCIAYLLYVYIYDVIVYVADVTVLCFRGLSGYAFVALVSYKSLNLSHVPYSDPDPESLDRNATYTLNSRVVTALVGNQDTSSLSEPVTLTFKHLQVPRCHRSESTIQSEGINSSPTS